MNVREFWNVEGGSRRRGFWNAEEIRKDINSNPFRGYDFERYKIMPIMKSYRPSHHKTKQEVEILAKELRKQGLEVKFQNYYSYDGFDGVMCLEVYKPGPNDTQRDGLFTIILFSLLVIPTLFIILNSIK